MMKSLLFESVRSLHRITGRRGLPPRISIYFHDLARQHWAPFRRCIAYYQALGYRCVPLETYLAGNADEKLLYVSFDDNLAEWHDALTLLDDMGVTATFYLNTAPIRDRTTAAERAGYFARIGYPDGKEALSQSQILELHAAGHTIGSHGHAHHNLMKLPQTQWHAELAEPKAILEDIVGARVVHYSYPFGMRRFFSDELRAFCLSAGFETIAAGIPGRLFEYPVNPHNVQRTRWQFSNSHQHNIDDVATDGRLFESLTGLSAVG